MGGDIYLLLGSNLGDRLKNLSDARSRIGSVVRSSPIYVTAAWGETEQPDFLNQVIEVGSELKPTDLLNRILQIETSMGRIRTEKWGPRVIDIDILFFRNEIIRTPNLVIPHPEIQNRRFALVPLNDLTNMMHPVLNKTISELLEECKDPLEVTRSPHQQ